MDPNTNAELISSSLCESYDGWSMSNEYDYYYRQTSVPALSQSGTVYSQWFSYMTTGSNTFTVHMYGWKINGNNNISLVTTPLLLFVLPN